MDVNYFEQIWSTKKTDKLASQTFWDSRADEFNQRVYKGEGDERVKKIFELLTSKGMLTAESNVLDIGCGPGKYVVQFAKTVKSVVGIDISPRMIECAKKNAVMENLQNAEFELVDWEELDVNSFGWNKKFDLVVASMCPAINNKSALEKMVNVSRGYCFMSSFVERTDDVKDHLSKYIVGQNSKGGHGKAIYCSFNILWLMGLHPEIIYIDTEWEHVMSANKAVDFYCTHFDMTQKLTDDKKAFIRNYLEQISENGLVKEKVKAKIAWMTWKV
jgi:SAM-dependent methyltransferase